MCDDDEGNGAAPVDSGPTAVLGQVGDETATRKPAGTDAGQPVVLA